MRNSLILSGFLLLLINLTVSLSAQKDVTNGIFYPGFPDRSVNTDVLPGFKNPPPGYGEVSFYWWLGDTLTKERITWQLDQLAGKSITALQVNYAHTDKGGNMYGLTFPGQPKLFSKDWWNLFSWFLQEAKKRNMSVSLSDYTLGNVGQGWYVDEMLKEYPELHGANLVSKSVDIRPGQDTLIQVPDNLINALAYRTESGVIIGESVKGLLSLVTRNTLHWKPSEGHWKVVLVSSQVVKTSYDPMNPLSGKLVVEKFFQPFEDHCPGEAGKGLNFFFSDELDFGIKGLLWNSSFASEFRRRKGYDLLPEIAGLFIDIGPRTPKIRMDYNDVLVTLSEENFFIPIYNWHTERGMIFGCDHGNRGQKVDEYGDYFRTVRWTSGPGCDQPALKRTISKNKVHSSISHLYERPRTWLEGYHSSGWGTSSAALADATFANFAMGQNLLTLHGLYYSTHGGWWEWAPPDNHFRQPYWANMDLFLKCTERLSYVLSQGVHRCDVAVMYPVAPVEAGMNGEAAVAAAFTIGDKLYSAGIDFDFIDFQSLERAKIKNGELLVSGESYKVLILPAMSAARFSTLEKARDFFLAGGLVIAVGSLPEASERAGRNDSQIQVINKKIFGAASDETANQSRLSNKSSSGKGSGVFLDNPDKVVAEVEWAITPDFKAFAAGVKPYILHRKAGGRDIYFVYGVPKDSVCSFRCTGKVELWNPWDGTVKEIPVLYSGSLTTRLQMPLSETEPQLIVFSQGDPLIAEETGTKAAKNEILLVGDWEFEQKPTLDNTWGDYRLPAYPGFVTTDAHVVRYKMETTPDPGWQNPVLNDSDWDTEMISYGPKFRKLGPLPGGTDSLLLEASLSALQSVDPSVPAISEGIKYYWSPYEFSWRMGLKDNAGHQGFHGLKGNVNDDIFQFGNAKRKWPGAPKPVITPEPGGTTYYLWSTINSDQDQLAKMVAGGVMPASIRVNGKLIENISDEVKLKKGSNTVLLKYSNTGTGYLVFTKMMASQEWNQTIPLSTKWYINPDILKYDCNPEFAGSAGWFRFNAPPGLKSIELATHQKPQVWVNGIELPVQSIVPASKAFANPRQKGWKADLYNIAAASASVVVRVRMDAGEYGGAALSEPIRLNCGKGVIRLGDLQDNETLRTYSGGMWYRKTVNLTAQQTGSPSINLDLGDLVSSAEVFINGISAGKRLAPPWKFNLNGRVKPGENKIEILIYNTLGNFYLTMPTEFTGSIRSGLIGPVKLIIE